MKNFVLAASLIASSVVWTVDASAAAFARAGSFISPSGFISGGLLSGSQFPEFAELEVDAVTTIYRNQISSGANFIATGDALTSVSTGRGFRFFFGGDAFAEVAAFGGSSVFLSVISVTKVTVTNLSAVDAVVAANFEWFDSPLFAAHDYDGESARSRASSWISTSPITDFRPFPVSGCDSTVPFLPNSPPNYCNIPPSSSGATGLSTIPPLAPGESWDFWFAVGASAEAVSVSAPGAAFLSVLPAAWIALRRRVLASAFAGS